MVMDRDGDSSPCRWAAMFDDHEADTKAQLVDLARHEQISRGKELLNLLWEPSATLDDAVSEAVPSQRPSASDMAAPAAVHIKPQWPASEVKVNVKNTFIELVSLPGRSKLQRSQSDSTLVVRSVDSSTWRSTLDQPIVGFSCDAHQTPPSKYQYIKVNEVGVHDIKLRDQVCLPQVLDLSTCLPDGECQWSTDGLLALSDASTDTPRESIEDISVYQGVDVPLLGDVMPDQMMDMFAPQFTVSTVYHQEDPQYTLPVGPGDVLMQNQAWLGSQFEGAADVANQEVDDASWALLSLQQSLPEASRFQTFQTLPGEASTCRNPDEYQYLSLAHGYMPMLQHLHRSALDLGQVFPPVQTSLAYPSSAGHGWPSSWE